MQITRAGEYGVMGLMHLARCGPGQRAMIDQVSREEGISKSFLAKNFPKVLSEPVWSVLSAAARGGFALARNPADIPVLEIIEAVEGRIVFQRCKMGSPRL